VNTDIDKGLFLTDIPENLSVANGNLEIIDYGYTVSDSTSLSSNLYYEPVIPTYMPEGFELTEVGYIDIERLEREGQKIPPVWRQPSFLTCKSDNKYMYICEDGIIDNERGNPFSASDLGYHDAQEILLENGIGYLYPQGVGDGTLYFMTDNIKVKITGNIGLEELRKVAESLIEAAQRNP